MRWKLLLVLACLMYPSSLALAQNLTPAESIGNPPVLLTPVQRGSQLDIGLIDDVCKLNERKTVVYRLKNAAVEDVAASINQWLQARLKSEHAKVDGFICNAPIIILPDAATNSLIVSMSVDFQDKPAVEKIIKQLDQAPPTVQIQAVLKKTVDGKTIVLGRPQLIVRENTQSSVTIDVDGEQYTLELSTRVITNLESESKIPHSATELTPQPTKTR